MLFLVFGAVAGSFLLTTIVTQQASGQVEALADTIVLETAPRIQRLAGLRADTLQAELALSRYLQERPVERGSRRPAVTEALDNLDSKVREHLAVPSLPGGQVHWRQLHDAWIGFEKGVIRAQDLADDGKDQLAQTVFSTMVEPAAARFIDAAMKAIDFNAETGRTLASQIKVTRDRTITLLNALTAFSVFLGLAGALLIDRQNRARRALVEAHSRFLQERAAELEQFAGRVAHDIRNPLATAKIAAHLLGGRPLEERSHELVQRITRALSRADAITTGLLDFARSGAQPDPGARTSPQEVISDMVAGMRPEAEGAGIELEVDDIPPVLVACSTGVYLSLVGNLVRNALKYMGDSGPKRITVRVVIEGDAARTEVGDTGPGIAADKIPNLFEPYFRTGSVGAEGLGLGLATVKKLAEGHGGQAGVSSTPGKGSTFWFVLPRAGRAAEAAAPRAESIPAAAGRAHPSDA